MFVTIQESPSPQNRNICQNFVIYETASKKLLLVRAETEVWNAVDITVNITSTLGDWIALAKQTTLDGTTLTESTFLKTNQIATVRHQVRTQRYKQKTRHLQNHFSESHSYLKCIGPPGFWVKAKSNRKWDKWESLTFLYQGWFCMNFTNFI